jgi:DNA replication protein DnaC
MTTTTETDALQARAKALGLWGLLAHWDEFRNEPWVERLVLAEEAERRRRSLQRRIDNARIGPFQPIADFDWNWPRKIPREAVDELFTLEFVRKGEGAVLVGPNGVGKSMIAQNLAYQAVLAGHTVRFTSASEMLAELAAQDGSVALQRRLRSYTHPTLLVIDELGYLSYDNRHADLLFDVVSRRYRQMSILVTTNLAFGDWSTVFPGAACVVALVDRLCHRAEIISIDGESYRLKEAKERAEEKARTAGRKKRRNVSTEEPE